MKKGVLNNRLMGFLLLGSVLAAGFSACSKDDEDDSLGNINPTGPTPAWGPTITDQMQTVVEKYQSYMLPPVWTITPQQARMQPSIGDAAMDVASDYSITPPAAKSDTTGKDIPVENGSIHLTVYTPTTGQSTYPLIMYYHGGGWVIATNKTYHSSAAALCEQVGAVVVSVEYRKGPEFKFPTAHNDAYAAYVWALTNAASIKADTVKVGVAGESAGGNLALNVSRMAKNNGRKMPLHQVLVYPVANNDTTAGSYIQYHDAVPLNKPSLDWFLANYLNNITESSDPRIALVKSDVSGLPSTTIIAAEIDPLQTEGRLLADKLTAAGVTVKYQLYTGVTHEFYGMNLVIPEAKNAEALAAQQLKDAFK